MAITSTQQTEILKIVAGLFNAAPGGTNLSDLANAVSGGMTTKQLANVLASNTLFTNGIMAGKVTTDAQAAVLMNNFGLVADSTTTSAGSQALAYFKSQIDAKVGFGDIVYNAVTFLSGSSVPPEFTAAATLLANKALVAESYSATNSSSDLSTLQSVVSEVTGTAPYTAADVTAALASVGDTVAPAVTAASFDYNENLKAGDTVATVAATDNVAVGGFNIVSGDTSGFFAIDATGKITLTTAGLASAMNDFETTPNTATLGITATDKAGNTSTAATVTLNVKDVDDVAPTVKSAVINSTTATVSFSEPLSTTAATPAIADFAVGIKGGSGTISVSALQVTGSTVVLTLGRAPATGETFTVAYTQGTNVLQDLAGNKAASFAATDIVVDTTAPAVTAGQTFTYVESVSDGKGGLTGPVNDTSDIIGTVAATDNTAVTSFSITSGNDKGWFAIDSAGKLTLTTAGLTAASNDFETTPNSFALGITVKDGSGNSSAVGSVTVSVTNNTADDVAVVTGQTFTLTTSPDNVVGTANNDTINAYIDAAGATDTLSAPDVIDGGAGTADALVITTDGNAGGALPAASISNVEVFSIREVGGTAGTYDFGTVAGETSVINRISTDALTLSNLAAGTSLTIRGDASSTNGATTFTMAAVTDAVALIIDGGYTGSANITRNQTGAATVTINSTGAANAVGVIDLDTGTLLTGLTVDATSNLTASLAADYAANSTLTGKGSAVIDLTGATLSTNITSVTGSTMTGGGLRVALGANTTSFVGGAGDDAVYVDALVIGSSKTVAAGGGTGDLIRLTDAAALTTTTAQYLTGFEILRLADDNDAALDTFDMSMLSGLTSLQLDADSAGDGYSITNMTTAQAGAVTIRGTQAVTPTFGVTGASTVGQIDTLGLTIDDGATTTSTITLANITASGVEKATVAMNDHLTVTLLTGMTALTNLTFSATAKNLSVTSGALALNVNTAVDASAVTGTVTLDLSAATSNGASIKGSATAVNTLKGGVGADVIVGGTGVDTVTVANTGADTVDFVSDASADIYELDSLSGRSTFTNFDAATTSTTEDLVNVTHNSIDGGEVSITSAAAQGAIVTDRTYVISQTVGTAAALTTGGTATLAAADYTATTLTNVATYLSERFTGDNDTLADEFAVIFLNNGTTTYAYTYSDSTTANTTIDAGELALVGVFTGSILNAGDVYQTV